MDVWTANSFGSIIRFMVLDVDGIITDSVQLALNIRDGKSDLPDFYKAVTNFLPTILICMHAFIYDISSNNL